jgi:hypothetical protein
MTDRDVCKNAPVGGARPMTVTLESVGSGSAQRRVATVTLTIAAADVPQRAGATGDDAWFVVRVRGQRAVFPMMTNGAISEANIDALVSGDDAEVAAALQGVGIPAQAFTAPVLVDFDGGGWKAPFGL